jgi:hypothetical protein
VEPTSAFLEGKLGFDANGLRVYEPRDAHKDNAARAILYMAARYHSLTEDWGLPDQISPTVLHGQDQETLKQWHWQDPPDRREIARNDFIASIQGSRNPFIDNPDWVCRINFKTMELIDGPEIPCLTTPNSIREVAFGSVGIFPNPTMGDLTVQLDMRQPELLRLEVLDMAGRAVHSDALNAGQGASQHRIDLNGLSEGVYILSLRGQQGVVTERVVVSR